jgi:hypothetical protein
VELTTRWSLVKPRPDGGPPAGIAVLTVSTGRMYSADHTVLAHANSHTVLHLKRIVPASKAGARQSILNRTAAAFRAPSGRMQFLIAQPGGSRSTAFAGSATPGRRPAPSGCPAEPGQEVSLCSAHHRPSSNDPSGYEALTRLFRVNCSHRTCAQFMLITTTNPCNYSYYADIK